MSLEGANEAELLGRITQTKITASQTLTGRDLCNLVDSSAGAVVLTLPHLHEWIGKFMSIYKVGSGTNSITLVVPGNEAYNYAAIEAGAVNLNAATDHVLLYCDGFGIQLVNNKIT